MTEQINGKESASETTFERPPLPRVKARRPVVGKERTQLAALLKQYYDEEGMSIRALAAAIKRSYAFVQHLLEEAGVDFRTNGGPREPGERRQQWETDRAEYAAWLRKQCEEKGMRPARLATAVLLDVTTVKKLLREAGMTFPSPKERAGSATNGSAKTPPKRRKRKRSSSAKATTAKRPRDDIKITPEELRRRYEEDGETIRELAAAIDRSYSVTMRILGAAGTAFRPKGSAYRKGVRREHWTKERMKAARARVPAEAGKTGQGEPPAGNSEKEAESND